jgi:hypothetical protein
MKAFIFEVAVLEEAVADSLQFSFHESLQVFAVDEFEDYSVRQRIGPT